MINSSSKSFAFFAIISANIIYGLNYVIAKGIMPDYLSPRAIIFFRIAGTIPISLLFFWLFVNEKIKYSDIPRFLLASFFGIALNQTLFFEGLNLTTPIDSAIIMTANPILVLVFSYFILKDRISLLKIAGIILGIAGAVLIITGKGELSFNSNTFTGNIFILINATSFALYLVIIKPLISKYHPMTIMVWTFCFGFLITLPITIIPFINSNFNTIPFTIWLSLLYVIIGSTFLGYLLYNYSLKVLSPTIVSFFIYLQPLFSTLTTMAVYGNKPSFVDYLSALLIFVGVWMVSKKTTDNNSTTIIT
jgi:drug/metabolite transporter (DMT)-like permease